MPDHAAKRSLAFGTHTWSRCVVIAVLQPATVELLPADRSPKADWNEAGWLNSLCYLAFVIVMNFVKDI